MQIRRAALLERESALQRWAVQLELEGAKQAAAGKALQQQLQKVRLCTCVASLTLQTLAGSKAVTCAPNGHWSGKTE